MRLGRIWLWLGREPLVHFLVGAASLFGVHAIAGRPIDDQHTIVVRRPELVRYLQYRAKTFDPERFAAVYDHLPVAARQRLIQAYVRDEVLYREAKALGLDRNDYVSRIRLVQEMAYLVEDVAAQDVQPNEADIRAFYDRTRAHYATPEEITFAHVFYSNDRRGRDRAYQRAAVALGTLNAAQATLSDATRQGDPALFQTNYVNQGREAVSRDFGVEMAAALFELTPSRSRWRGPFQSPYGSHLVMLTEHRAASIPPLAAVRGRVAEDLGLELRRRKLDQAIDRTIAEYRVRGPGEPYVTTPVR